MYSQEKLFKPEFWHFLEAEDYTFGVPRHWIETDPPFPALDYQIINDFDNEDHVLMLQTGSEKVSELVPDVETYIDLMEENWKKLVKGYRLKEKKWIEDEHVPYFYASYYTVEEEVDFLVHTYLWFMGRKVIMFNMMHDAGAEEEEDFQKLLQVLLGLFKIKINFD